MSAARDYPPPPDVIRGRVAWVFGDDFDIDLVIGVENIKSYDAEFLRSKVMRAYDPGFADRVRPGDVIVGGRNFGYGHPHYPPMVALRDLGIAAVLAGSFSPGFWRGETYNGVPLVTVPGIAAAVATGDPVAVDWRAATVSLGDGRVLRGTPPSDRVVRVIEAGGSLKLLLAEHART
ncbi:3-isopropylmalate dehydratase small subunit [Amycolatopsis thermophila]|uniref:Alpha-IPM isomerase n=1 Tax=Amycolatopsis thermophila TaxID=206084 RepID=A0ABU0F043_9PSEU|nr:3-isopropylmalate dehydratase [Amycolatopsis thermophila]MDQ0380944.1 3-isopropylmalate/(R)-2-methylmalate dehydratase small subunit [Amycolatopsis thermophila]